MKHNPAIILDAVFRLQRYRQACPQVTITHQAAPWWRWVAQWEQDGQPCALTDP